MDSEIVANINAPKFVLILYSILKIHGDILCWTADGRQFKILDQDRFMKEVVPNYFSHTHFTSFQRQLNYFGFMQCGKKTTTPKVYSHTNFRRDQPHQMEFIIRKTNKKTKNANISSKATMDGQNKKKTSLSYLLNPFQDATEIIKEYEKVPDLSSINKYVESHGAFTLQDIKASLSSSCIIHDPLNFHKSSDIDSHGVRYWKDNTFIWKCRYCLQAISVGHGIPNAHLRNIHHIHLKSSKRKSSDGESSHTDSPRHHSTTVEI